MFHTNHELLLNGPEPPTLRSAGAYWAKDDCARKFWIAWKVTGEYAASRSFTNRTSQAMLGNPTTIWVSGPRLSISKSADTSAITPSAVSRTAMRTVSPAICTREFGSPGVNPSGDSHIGALSACTAAAGKHASSATSKLS